MRRWRRAAGATLALLAVLLVAVSITAAPMAYTALRNRGTHGALTITQVDCTPDRCDYRGSWRADPPYERVIDDVLLDDVRRTSGRETSPRRSISTRSSRRWSTPAASLRAGWPC